MSGRADGRKTRLVWWGLLLAPYAGYVLAFSVAQVLLRLRLETIPLEEFRELVICVGSGLSSGSVMAAFMLPTAWVLERILHRVRSRPDRFLHVTLKIMTLAVYAHGTRWILKSCNYIAKDDSALSSFSHVTAAFELALVPLAVVWAVVVFRGRRSAVPAVRPR